MTRTIKRHRSTFLDSTPMTIRNAFDASRVIIQATGQATHESSACVNLSDIQSLVIKKAGDICDSYASDVLINFECLGETLKQLYKYETNSTLMFLMGIRKSGVDSIDAVLSNLKKTVNPYTGFISPRYDYHTIYAIEVECAAKGPAPENETYSAPYVTVTLKDITNNLYKIHTSDMPDDIPCHFTDTPRPDPSGMPKTDADIEAMIHIFYQRFQRWWIYKSDIDLGIVAEYITEHGYAAGIPGPYSSTLPSYDEFRETAFLDEQLMKDALTINQFEIYERMLDILY